MGCACKVNEQISQLNNVYGSKRSTELNTRETIKLVFKKGLYALILVPLVPILFLYVVFKKIFKNTPIVLDKLLKIKK